MEKLKIRHLQNLSALPQKINYMLCCMVAIARSYTVVTTMAANHVPVSPHIKGFKRNF